MKKVKILLVAFLTLILGVGLASCGGGDKKPDPNPNPPKVNPNPQPSSNLLNGFTTFASNPDATNKPLVGSEKDEYNVAGHTIKVKKVLNTAYIADIDDAKLNYLFNAEQQNNDVYADILDGLVDNNKATQIVGALALGKKVTENEDGTETHTYQIRKNVVWFHNVTGEPYKVNGQVQYVTPEDFVTSAFFTLKSKGAQASSQYTNFIVGAKEFNELATSDNEGQPKLTNEQLRAKFNELVKVKADMTNYTISYTILKPITYFDSVLTYSPYLPVSQAFLDEVGESQFGQNINNVLGNGAFYITEYTPSSKIQYKKNPNSYWDSEHVYLDEINEIFLGNNQDPSKTRQLYEAGELDSFVVNKNDVEGWNKYVGKGNTSKNPKNPDTTPIFNTQGGTTWFYMFNFNRTYFPSNYYKTDKQRKDTKAAFLNQNFRLGFVYGQNKMKAEAVNSTTPGDDIYRGFTTIDLAADTKGRDYTEYVLDLYKKATGNDNARLDGASLNYDPKYSPEKSKAYFTKAKEELEKQGVAFPIMVDVLDGYTPSSQREIHTLYGSLEENSVVDGNQLIKIHYIKVNTYSERQQMVDQGNYDIYGSGWSADYADPYGFLTVFAKGGFYLKYMGLNPDELTNQADKDEAIRIYNLLFGEYNKNLQAANKLYKIEQTEERFQKLAQIEYNSIFVNALFDPWGNDYSWSANVGRIVPYQAAKSKYGITTSRHKNVVVAKEPVSRQIKSDLVADLLRLQGAANVSGKVINLLAPDGNPLDDQWSNYTLNVSGKEGDFADLPNSINFATNQIVVGWYRNKELTEKPETNGGGKTIFSDGNQTLYAKIAKMNTIKSFNITLDNEKLSNNQVVAKDLLGLYNDDQMKYKLVVEPVYSNPEQTVQLTPEEQEKAKENYSISEKSVRALIPGKGIDNKVENYDNIYYISIPNIYKSLQYYRFLFGALKNTVDKENKYVINYDLLRTWDPNNTPLFTFTIKGPFDTFTTPLDVAKTEFPLLSNLDTATLKDIDKLSTIIDTLKDYSEIELYTPYLSDIIKKAEAKYNELKQQLDKLVSDYKEANKDALALTTETVKVTDEEKVTNALNAYSALDARAQAELKSEKDLLSQLKSKIAELKSETSENNTATSNN